MATALEKAEAPDLGFEPQKDAKAVETPLAAFARELNTLRAGTPFRELARRAHVSYTALARAARGDGVPSWTITVAFLAACDVTDEREKARWKRKLEKVRAWERNSLLSMQGIDSAKRLRAERKASGGSGVSADPACVVTAAHLAEELRRLKLAAGNPSYSRIAWRTAQPRSTVGDMLSGRCFPRAEVYEAVVSCLLHLAQRLAPHRQAEFGSWMDAFWRVAERRYVLGQRRRRARS
ncbi:hypothetical protein GCM10029963_79800 [Micromonospora andamanensis]|uniref:hypothetical protein n=1 Tax=Micromonospora andamanensis TaxID=1287068 RepID=UPI0019529737|nr:hypothetical protein [Micromonospora andamanensis]GIJ40536.1 hypothetical protein Vwe01_38610 [Micromonospora andamanensis]